MTISVLDPLTDDRWVEFVGRHPSASVFHQRGWLRALARTYGYKPYVLTSAQPGEPLDNGIPICHIFSWITGMRVVSLPFSDHCEPLLNDEAEAEEFIARMLEECKLQKFRYVEFRPLTMVFPAGRGLPASCSYWFHELDLRSSLDHIFEKLHKNSFQRKIHRAEREGLSFEAGRSQQLVDEFYRLLLGTRGRQQLLPQPREWFKNLLECMGDGLQISLTRKNGVPIASLLTLRHRSSVVYKYGCSDEKYHNLGGMPFLFWKLIVESKAAGIEKIDFGRTDLDNESLIAFKDRLGASRRLLTYYRYSKTSRRGFASVLRDSQAVRRFISLMPEIVSAKAGGLLYRHLG